MSAVFSQHGAFSWNELITTELVTTDMAAAEAVYSQMFT